MGKCPSCARTIDEHSLEESWLCLDKLAIAAAELAARACGGSVAALMEMERIRRPHPSYRR